MGKTPIQWTDRSVNPFVALLGEGKGHHCVKVSAGCTHCYSSRMQPRFGMPTFDQVKARRAVQHRLDLRRLREVLTRRKPTKWFWCDMTDMFGEWVPDEHLDRCFAAMAGTPQHIHQLLTKRPERMRDYINTPGRAGAVAAHTGSGCEDLGLGNGLEVPFIRPDNMPWPLPNVWCGTSVENQAAADERIPLLCETQAALRFLSAEPLLFPLDLDPFHVDIHWVIVGGESGPKARTCNIDWIRQIVACCRTFGIPAFVKQLGREPVETNRADGGNSVISLAIRDSHGGAMEEWPEDLRVRDFPQ